VAKSTRPDLEPTSLVVGSCSASAQGLNMAAAIAAVLASGESPWCQTAPVVSTAPQTAKP
jgi:hypothetical protein